MKMHVLAIAAAVLLAGPATAEEFRTISDENSFLTALKGRALTRFGIRLAVTPEGRIEGRAFGTPVTGDWRWQDGYFCRSLFYGAQDLGPNCQQVKLKGDTLRFISDRGQGIYADLRLQ